MVGGEERPREGVVSHRYPFGPLGELSCLDDREPPDDDQDCEHDPEQEDRLALGRKTKKRRQSDAERCEAEDYSQKTSLS